MANDPHPNVEILRRTFAAMAAGDIDTIRSLQSEDFTLTVAGNSAISGTFDAAGAGGQFQHSMELTNGQLRIEPQHLLADDEMGIAFLKATAQRPDGRTIEQRLIHQVRFDGGRIASVHEWIWDQDADRRFWS